MRPNSLRRALALTAAVAVTELLMSCGGSNGGASPGTPATPTTALPGTGTATADQATPTPTGTPTQTETATQATDNRPVVGNVQLSPRNVQCSYVPHGNIDGSDGLTVFAYTLLIGSSGLPGPISTTMSISNGFSTTYTGHPNNSAAQTFQGPIRSGDWGQALTVTIHADADDRYRETSEADNQIEVTVNLPNTRPARTVDPLSCSARQA
jgi:hypothetical protein